MEKTTREELIATLVTNRFSGFKDGDEAMLGSASDARLEEFRAAAVASRSTSESIARMESESRQEKARLKVAEERVTKLEQPMSDADFVARLSPTSPIRAMLETREAEEKTIKDKLVTALKNLGGETEEQLRKKDLSELQLLASYANVKVHDFSGRGMPVNRSAGDKRPSYVPPDPYKADIEKMRAAEAKR